MKKEFKLSLDIHFRLGAIVLIRQLVVCFRCIDSKSRPTYAEKIFLFIGALMFFAVGKFDNENFSFSTEECLLDRWSSAGVD